MLPLHKRSCPEDDDEADDDRKDTRDEKVGHDGHGRFAAIPHPIRLARGTHGTDHDAAWRTIPLKCFKGPMFYTFQSGKNADC